MYRVLTSLVLASVVSASLAQPVTPTRNESEVTVKVTWYETRKELVEYCYSIGTWGQAPREFVDKQRHVGCAVFDLNSKVCTVHAVRPKYLDDMLTTMFGHEVLHCFKGRYHP